ncbi:MAG: restriction endonuclease subunit S, partial [Clostridia bacterium]|nr:restriction endonuclease subunit S [Clostridia bacterium]
LKELAEVQSGEFIEEINYGDIGYSYIRGTDITNDIINFDDATKVNINIDNYKHIDKNDIAFAMIGSVGNVAINKKKKCIVSNNLGAIKPFDKSLSNYLLMVLSSQIGQLLFEKYQTRTAQPKIRKEDVENFVIPLLDDEITNEINNKIEESFRLREQSKRLLDNAVKAVEMAIETDEESAQLWIEMQN